MSYVRMNYLEYVSEQAADELEAHNVQNTPTNFQDAPALVFLRTGPKTASLTSVYPDKVTFEKSAAQRKKSLAGIAAKIKDVRSETGQAFLSLG